MSALVIHKTAFTDEGKYTCEVVNKLGSKKSNAKVTITGLPSQDFMNSASCRDLGSSIAR